MWPSIFSPRTHRHDGKGDMSDLGEAEETCSFLPPPTKSDVADAASARSRSESALPWKVATGVQALLLLLALFLRIQDKLAPTYESGFDTDLQPAKPAIQMQKKRFQGGIIVNSSSQFELVLDATAPRYTGRPTQKLDDNWDRLVGGYLALSEPEAQTIAGHVSLDGSSYFVVPHVRHSLHCVNYLRKVAYDKYYPTVRTENKPTVPTFWMHVDHCIETLRETIQCQSDLTPVPHVWSEGKQMYLADTSLEHTCRDYRAIMEWQDQRTRHEPTGP